MGLLINKDGDFLKFFDSRFSLNQSLSQAKLSYLNRILTFFLDSTFWMKYSRGIFRGKSGLSQICKLVSSPGWSAGRTARCCWGSSVRRGHPPRTASRAAPQRRRRNVASTWAPPSSIPRRRGRSAQRTRSRRPSTNRPPQTAPRLQQKHAHVTDWCKQESARPNATVFHCIVKEPTVSVRRR